MFHLLLKDFRKDRQSSQRGSTQKLSILLIFIICFVALVVILAWLALDRVKEKIQSDVGETVRIVLQTTQESLNLWVESNIIFTPRFLRCGFYRYYRNRRTPNSPRGNQKT